jgi:putative peptidoglycan lipid II flippase
MSEPAKQLSARSVGVVGVAVLCSRVLGLGRELILAHLFGAGLAMDAFKVAFRIPNLLRDLFAEGALSTALVTTFSKKDATEGSEAAWALANKVASLATVVIGLLVVVGVVFSPAVVDVIASGFDGEKAELTVQLTRIMFPFILLVSLAALAMGLLNAKNVFGAPAMASSFFNIGSILGGVGFAWWLDPGFGPRSLVGLAIGTLLGGLAQFMAQWPALYRVGYRFCLDFQWRDSGVQEVLRLMGPAVIAASAVQVNVMVNSHFASMVPGDGPVSWLDYAFRLMQLPLGVFGVAIGTVTLPLVSRHAALGDTTALRAALSKGLRLGFLLTVPSSIGLACLADPIISIIYERGRFDAASTAQTAGALRFYAIGLAAYAGIKVLAPAFYAVGRRKTPMLVSFWAIGVNLILNWYFTLHLQMGHRGLALSTGCIAVANFTALYLLMRAHLKGLESASMLAALARILLAAALMAGVCLLGASQISEQWALLGLPMRIFQLSCIIGAAALVFFGAAALLRVGEMRELVAVLRRKIQGRGSQKSKSE